MNVNRDKITPPDPLGRKKGRDSNLELYRVLAMFFVLVVHADFLSLGVPTSLEYHDEPLSASARLFFQSLSIGSVDMFILISGWFGIRPKPKSFLNFVFQCFFFLCGIYVFCIITGLQSWSIKGFLGYFGMRNVYWFVKAYIGLYILAPVLNAFVEKTDERGLRMLLIYFYLFQTLFSWCTGAATFFVGGYSTLSFIGLYLLARYVRLYPMRWTSFPAKADFLIFASIVFLQTLIACLGLYIGLSPIVGKVSSYVNPLVIISSVYLLLGFSKLRFQNRFVNWLGASSFTVYLIHNNRLLANSYFSIVQWFYHQFDGVLFLLLIMIFLVLVFLFSVLIDQFRIIIWKLIWGCCEKGKYVKNF